METYPPHGSPEEQAEPELNPHQRLFVDAFTEQYGPGALIVSPNGKYRGTPAEFALGCSHVDGIDAQGIFEMFVLGLQNGARIIPAEEAGQ